MPTPLHLRSWCRSVPGGRTPHLRGRGKHLLRRLPSQQETGLLLHRRLARRSRRTDPTGRSRHLGVRRRRNRRTGHVPPFSDGSWGRSSPISCARRGARRNKTRPEGRRRALVNAPLRRRGRGHRSQARRASTSPRSRRRAAPARRQQSRWWPAIGTTHYWTITPTTKRQKVPVERPTPQTPVVRLASSASSRFHSRSGRSVLNMPWSSDPGRFCAALQQREVGSVQRPSIQRHGEVNCP